MKSKIIAASVLIQAQVLFTYLPIQARAETHVVRTAKANLINSAGEKVGTATLIETKDGVRIALQAERLSPGEHGIHLHEKGKCLAPDFKSAGSHFNPAGTHHGLKNTNGPHAGDLPNVQVSGEGLVKTDLMAKNVTLKKDAANSLTRPGGTSLVIHAQVDDQKSDPAGNSGDRVVCGVIQSDTNTP